VHVLPSVQLAEEAQHAWGPRAVEAHVKDRERERVSIGAQCWQKDSWRLRAECASDALLADTRAKQTGQARR
jgi:hypothetical protein